MREPPPRHTIGTSKVSHVCSSTPSVGPYGTAGSRFTFPSSCGCKHMMGFWWAAGYLTSTKREHPLLKSWYVKPRILATISYPNFQARAPSNPTNLQPKKSATWSGVPPLQLNLCWSRSSATNIHKLFLYWSFTSRFCTKIWSTYLLLQLIQTYFCTCLLLMPGYLES